MLEKLRENYTPYQLSWKDTLPALMIFIAAAFLYTYTMTPSVSAGDNGELTTAMFYLGIAHAPCYPLHSFIGKIFTFLPINNVGWRSNFFSAFCGALTIFLSSLVFFKILVSTGINRFFAHVSAVLAGLLFMFSDTLWSQAVMCEVYTLSAIFYPLHLLILLKWFDSLVKHRHDDTPWFGEQYLLAFSFLFGVSLTNHQTTLVTGLYTGLIILSGLFLYTLNGRKLTKKQIDKGISLLVYLAVVLVIIVVPYAKKIVSLNSNLYQKSNVMTGMGAFIFGNVLLVLPYLYYKFLAPDERDPENYLQKGVLTIIKMLVMFYLGWGILAYMFIRSHGNPPINWMGISEAKELWLKIGKLWNAVYRKQYGNMGKLPLTTFNFIHQLKLNIFKINGSQFSLPFYGIGLLGLIQLFRKNLYWFIIILFAFISYNIALIFNLRYNFDERSLFFVKVFFIFSYFIIALTVAYGISAVLEFFSGFFKKKGGGNA